MKQIVTKQTVTKQTVTEQNRAIAHRFLVQGWGTLPDWQTVWNELMTNDVVHHFNSDPAPIVGLENNKAFNAGLFQGFPDITHELQHMVAEGDKVVYKTVLTGTHTGEFLSIAPTGKSATLSDFTMLKIADGKIVEWWYDCNLLALMQQLGIL